MSLSLSSTQNSLSVFPRRSHVKEQQHAIIEQPHRTKPFAPEVVTNNTASSFGMGAKSAVVLVPTVAGTSLVANGLEAPQPTFTVVQPVSAAATKAKVKPTAGMKLFDTVLYPVLTNAVVFAISVFATYQTAHGKEGSFLKTRGDQFMGILKEKFKLSPENAEMARMVTFSFVDGSLMAPAVVLLENYSVPIAKKLDGLLGTEPQDDAPYAEREKHHQTWGSILTGRLATCAIVVPTAVALSRKVGVFGDKSLNTILFDEPGKTFGQYIQEKYPAVQQKFPKLNIPYLGKTATFEAFYTSVCTAGLYVSSRLISGPIADTIKAWRVNTSAKQATTQPQRQSA